MRKIFCLLLLMMVLIINVYIDRNSKSVMTYFFNVNSLQVVVDENFNKENIDYNNIVCNGNKYILTMEDLESLNNINYIGFTVSIDQKKFNLNNFINEFDIHIDNKYVLNDMIIYEGSSNNFKGISFKSVQIAIRQADTVIGFPMILNSF